MDMVYAIQNNVVLSSVQEDFDRLEQWKLGKETITQLAVENDGAIVRDNSQLKVVNSVIVLKDDVDFIPALIVQADALRNSITESEITAGFEWPPIDGVIFRMTAENQRNFTNLDRMANKGLLTYPYAIWCGEESVELADEQAVEDFYLMGVSFITQKLNEGKTVRASFRTMTKSELEQWIANNS